MKAEGDNTKGRRISRREFAKKGFVVLAVLGTAGMGAYVISNGKKLRTLNNYLRMGHCAPTVMKTLLDINGVQNTSLVTYSGGLAGGIAGPGMECGVLTAPLMYMGFRNGNLSRLPEQLKIISIAQSYINEFNRLNGSSVCINIRNGGMESCRKAVCGFYKPFIEANLNQIPLALEKRDSYSMLFKAFDERKFHCSHNVFYNLSGNYLDSKELFDSSWPFIGGMAMLNRTCGALTAGVIAISSATSVIENSYSRVARMNRLFREENNEAMNNEINNFNKAINYSRELGLWFRNEFGSTTCYDICGLNFSRIKDAQQYISGNCIGRCERIAEKVAEKVNAIT
jgi:hypothetical protein